MSGTLKKVIGVLAILLIGMLLLGVVINIFFPNIVIGVSNAIEDSIYKMTNFKFDINNDGQFGGADRGQYGNEADTNAKDDLNSGAVEGFSAD